MLYGWQHHAGVMSTLPQESPFLFLAVGLLCLAVDVHALPQESPLPFLAVGLLCLAVDVPALNQEAMTFTPGCHVLLCKYATHAHQHQR